MKHRLVIALITAISIVALRGDTPPAVTTQLTEDLISFVKARGKGKHTDEQISQVVAKIVGDSITRHPSAFEYSAEELQHFKDGRAIYSDKDIRAAYTELKSVANGLPMPVLTEYYHSEFEAGKLSAQQKTIFQRLTLAIIRDAKKSKSEQGGADQPATAPESKPEGKEKPKPESGARSQ